MTSKCFIFLLGILASCATAQAQTTQATSRPASLSQTELARRSANAIDRGVKFLLNKQNPDGGWGDTRLTSRGVGTTALVTLALLSCGESHQAPHVAKAIEFLKRGYPQEGRDQTYAVALRACVWAQLPEPLRQRGLREDLRWLQLNVIRSGNARGMYHYGPRGGGDYSNSQYGVLGVWYATEAGLEVPRAYWKLIEDAWVNGQSADGGWGYVPKARSYGSMTAAGAATLFITSDYVHANDARNLSRATRNEPLERAMEWLARNFAADRNPGRDPPNPEPVVVARGDQFNEPQPVPGRWVHYMLFGYERVGEASGLTRWGEHKWFDLGADYLHRTQNYDGSWIGTIGPDCDTAYALLFLARGRAPIVMQKLQISDRWNNRPRDAYGFVRFMRRATERHVNWQVVSIDADQAELRESPMLYLASDRAIELSAEQKARLKAYIDQGGLLVCANEGDGDALANSIVALGKELFPRSPFRDLPKDHQVYTANFPVEAPVEPIRALSNGLRELIVLFPREDMSWQWHSASGSFDPRSTPYAALANLWLYATNRANPRFKGEDTWIERNPGVQPTRTVRIARVPHPGNWDPEPGGWARLSNILHNFDQLTVEFELLSIAPAQGEAPRDAAVDRGVRPQLAHLTSTAPVQLPPPLRDAVRQYLDRGGLLLCDAAAGVPGVGESFDALLRGIYPEVLITPLPLDHPVYRGAAFGGAEIEEVEYRPSPGMRAVHLPRLRGATVKGRLIAIISNEDLSGGLVGYSTAGLVGYAPTSATELVRNIILWRASIKTK